MQGSDGDNKAGHKKPAVKAKPPKPRKRRRRKNDRPRSNYDPASAMPLASTGVPMGSTSGASDPSPSSSGMHIFTVDDRCIPLPTITAMDTVERCKQVLSVSEGLDPMHQAIFLLNTQTGTSYELPNSAVLLEAGLCEEHMRLQVVLRVPSTLLRLALPGGPPCLRVQGMERIAAEMSLLEKRPWATVTPLDTNFYDYIVVINPSEDSPWKNIPHTFHIQLPMNYPTEPPRLSLLTPVWHPNFKGSQCGVSLFCESWSPALTAFGVLIDKLYNAFRQPVLTPDCVLQPPPRELLLQQPEQWARTSRNISLILAACVWTPGTHVCFPRRIRSRIEALYMVARRVGEGANVKPVYPEALLWRLKPGALQCIAVYIAADYVIQLRRMCY